MNSADIASDLQQRLRAAQCPSHRKGMEEYFTTGMSFLGVKTPILRSLVKETAASLRSEEGQIVFEAAIRLVSSGVFEDRQAAYELLSRHKAAFAMLGRKQLEELGQGNDNWASVDTLACHLAGPRWLQGGLEDKTLLAWARSQDLWWRRTAIVCTTTLNKKLRGGKGDPVRTLRVIRLVMAERHPMITKAVSWALRELVLWAPKQVAEFLVENEATLAPLVRREVHNKLTTGMKNPR